MDVIQPGTSLINFKLPADGFASRTQHAMDTHRQQLDELVTLLSSPSSVTFDAVIPRLASLQTNLRIESASLTFPMNIAVDKAVRDASNDAKKALATYEVETSMRVDVFQLLQMVHENTAEKDAYPTPESRRFVERLLRDGRRNGLHLNEERRAQIKQVKAKISDLATAFSKNIGEENTTLAFTAQQLAGVSDQFLSSLDRNDLDQFILTLKTPHYFPIMKKCDVASTRQAMERAYNSRCAKENGPIIEQLAVLRHELAQLLGYDTFAQYITEIRMAKTPQNVETFLLDLNARLKPLHAQEIAVLEAAKKQQEPEAESPHIQMHDFRYYLNLVEERDFQIDHDVIKEYFPLEAVSRGLFSIYEELLGITFHRQVDDPTLWHPDVQLWRVQEKDSGTLVGHFYLDLHPREGKYSHAAVFGLIPGYELPDGTGRQAAVAAMVCNFPKPTPTQPSLLTHADVETFFHEFGHAAHQLCARAEYALFAGTAVERDFVEAPSQALENWCWEVPALQRMSAHIKTGAPLPEDLARALIRSRNCNVASLTKRQLVFSLFDQRLHTSGHPDGLDSAALYAKVSQEVIGISPTSDTNFVASFGHMVGYEAQYYGYLWSEVFSQDIYATRFLAEGIFNPETGASYRKCILEPGGSIDADDMLKNFLGRPSNADAFLKSKGL